MPRWTRVLLIAVGSLAALVALVLLVVPLLWPVPPLQGTLPESSLAFDDSRFVDVDGVRIHYREAGWDGAEQTFILLHGFGASTFSWRDQLELLSDRGRVIAFDRPAFGLTQRPMPGQWNGNNPYSPQANAEQVIGLMDRLGVKKAVVVGHSAGAAVAALVAAQHPDRIEALVLEAPAVAQARTLPSFVSALLRSPQGRRLGPLFARRLADSSADDFIRGAYYDESVATDAVIAGYRLPLRAQNWDRALWELVAAPRTVSAQAALSRIAVPTLVVAGRQDTFVPYEDSVAVARGIRDARMRSFDKTGHLPHEEQPQRFADEVFRFLDELPSACGT